MSGTTYLAGRALLALVLMLAFYGLALAMVGLLLGVLYLEVYLGKFQLQITLFCLIGAFLIVKAIVPRPDRFPAPGPRLGPGGQPRVFAEIREVAAATGQAMPADVYLILEVNAWVSQRGGFMGFGSRRVMGLGLPLLQALDVSEFRAVIAHEFGHYHGGDVGIGPWIYKTRAALGRTLQELGEHSGFLTIPFHWYAALFFRVTHAVSRHQELLADALAAKVAGASALGRGLRATHAAALVFPAYMHHEVDPVVTAGYLPPLAAGFAGVLEVPTIAQGVEQALRKELEEGKPDPYDTHPPLRERLAALGVASSESAHRAGPRALSLLESVPDLESELATGWASRYHPAEGGTSLNLNPRVVSLTPVSWDEVGTRVSLPGWRRFVKQFAGLLAGVTPASLPALDWAELGGKIARGGTGADAFAAAEGVVGVAVGLALVRAGYVIDSHPGSPHAVVRGDERIDVFALRERLTRSPEEAEAWRAFCARIGIAADDLGALASGTG